MFCEPVAIGEVAGFLGSLPSFVWRPLRPLSGSNHNVFYDVYRFFIILIDFHRFSRIFMFSILVIDFHIFNGFS